MKKQLEQFFGCEVKVIEYKGKLQLPIYMTMRHISLVELAGIRFAVVNIVKEDGLTVATLRKQQKKYEEVLHCPVAYELTITGLAMRNALIKNGVSFIDMPRNVFLPFAGIVLQDAYAKQNIKKDKMMPATQMVFLELLYMDDDKSAHKSEIAKKLNLTKTSITRATAQLEEMGLIIQQKSGTEISVRRNTSRKEYYAKGKEYLISPVQRTITVMKDETMGSMWSAGETALSQISLLNPPRIEQMAIYKGDEAVKQFEMIDASLAEQGHVVNVQLWKYNPAYFAENEIVDRVSLACSFIGNEDERIEMSIEELLEEL